MPRPAGTALVRILFVFLFACTLPARAADNGTHICGDYQYTPLSGYTIQKNVIKPGAAWVLINPLPWKRTQKDLDTPTIYCLTEENRGSYNYKLSEKETIFMRTLAKQEKRMELSSGTCDAIDKETVYFLSTRPGFDGDVRYEHHGLIVIELNEPGNAHDAIFVISPGSLDRDMPRMDPEEARTALRGRMCGRARELIGTIRKR